MSRVSLPDRPTGPQLIAALELLAAARGESLVDLAGRLSPKPASWLRGVAAAAFPAKHTVARVRALIAGEAPPPARSCQRLREGPGEPGSKNVVRHFQPPDPSDRRRPAASREPCPRCGTRGDLGCAHLAPFHEEVGIESA